MITTLIRKQMRVARAGIAAILVLQLLWLPAVVPEPQYLTIIHFNDFHGQLLPLEQDGKSVGGLARVATMVDETRDWNDPHNVPTLLLNAGDVLQGTPLSTVFHGKPDFICLNLMDLDAMVIGNHEFDFGQENLLELMKLAQFPVISANIRYQATGHWLALPLVKCTLGSQEAIIFALTTPDTATESDPKKVRGLQFLDPIATARGIVEDYRGKVKFFIALTHLGKEADIKLAQAVPEIDLIIGGHSHDALQPPLTVGNTLICQAGSQGLYLGQVDMVVDDGQIIKWRGFLRPVDAGYALRPDVQEVIDLYDQTIQKEIKQVIAQAKVALNGEREAVRSGETNLGNLLADIAREFTQTDVALLNGGGIRANISQGPITIEDVMRVLPFGNKLAKVDLTGRQLRAVLEFDAALVRPHGGFLQVSGLNLIIDGQTLSEVTVAGQPLDPDQTYSVTTNEFLLSGGNGYTMLADGQNACLLGSTISAIVIDALRLQGEVSAELEGRIAIR